MGKKFDSFDAKLTVFTNNMKNDMEIAKHDMKKSCNQTQTRMKRMFKND